MRDDVLLELIEERFRALVQTCVALFTLAVWAGMWIGGFYLVIRFIHWAWMV
jgi:TRAP-type C4-dicarboxylate transport system permease small subunit